MRLFPKLPYQLPKKQQEALTFRGINYSDNYADGALAESKNLSVSRFPYITVRNGRKDKGISGCTAITSWGGALITVRGTNLMYNNTVVGQVTAGQKQMAVVNTKLVIFPDKKYLDLNTQQLYPLGPTVVYTDEIGIEFAEDDIHISAQATTDFTEHFAVGNKITISGVVEEELESNNKTVTIKKIDSHRITVTDPQAFVEGITHRMVIKSNIPDLDYICESENRLWGCNGTEQTIYASALGDPRVFYDFSGESTDSYAVAVGSDGRFTGCAKLGSSVLFWKENCLHKMLGSYPAEYQLYTYEMEGVRNDCWRSMQVIGDSLFYVGNHGVYAYSGGGTSALSDVFGNRTYNNAVAGTDGERYYLSCEDAAGWHLFVYNLKTGIWVEEDDSQALDFARKGKDLYMVLSGGRVLLMDSGHHYDYDADSEQVPIEWLAQYKPFYGRLTESKTGMAGRKTGMAGRKKNERLLIRFEVPAGCWMTVESREDGGRWNTLKTVIGALNDTVAIPLPNSRCDKYELRISGKGNCTIHGITRIYTMGSAR